MVATGRTIRAAGAPLLLAAVAMTLGGCRRKHVPVDAEPELGYPACVPGDAGVDDDGTPVARGHIRGGPFSAEKNVAERFTLARTACGYTFRSRQEWPMDTSDVEVRYDANLSPLWAWKRMTIGGSKRADGNAEFRRYELRTGDVFIKKRDATGAVTLEQLLPGGRMATPRGSRIGAVIGPGRGILTAWLKRAKLRVGQKAYELVLDFRSMVEQLEIAMLERNEDRMEPTLNAMVRVYTFFGQETIFADEDDVVLGDLAGMRPSDAVPFPEPEPVPTFGGADPAHTP